MDKYPKEKISLFVSWGCAPDNVDQLVQTVFHEMDTLRNNGPLQVNLEKARETAVRNYETNFEKNSYWVSKIKNMAYYDEELLSLEDIKQYIQGCEPKDLQELANKYFSEDHYLKVVLLPEED
jgi:zinc protease